MTALPDLPEPIDVEVVAADAYVLRGSFHEPRSTARAQLIVAGATGVPQSFYQRFAEYAAQRGYATLRFDYRGVGRSAPATLRGYEMDYLDWARLDLAAVIEHLYRPDLPLFIIGHSFGGHALGLLPNHGKVTGLYCFGSGAGWHGWMSPAEQIKVRLLWSIVAPIVTSYACYLAWSRLGMGEDLPLGVYRQWKRWCRYPNYFFGDPDQRGAVEAFAQVRTPIVAVTSLDDPWAPPRSRDAFMAGYANAPLERRDIDPAAFGARPIGHVGYFRNGMESLWDDALAWCEAKSGTPS